jgi:hypothetical protein
VLLCLAALAFAPQDARATEVFARPAVQSGPVILRGGPDAKMPEEFAALKRERILLAASESEARAAGGDGVIALAPRSWIGDEPELAERIARAERIDFAPAVATAWLSALYPKASESRLVEILRERHRTGAPICAEGRSVGLCAAFALIRPDERALGGSEQRERVPRNPRRLGQRDATRGLSYLSWAMVTCDDDLDGSLAPIFAVAFDRHLRLAFHLAPRATLVADVVHGAIESRGDEPALVFDLRGARRGRDSICDMRWSVLWDKDRWSVRTRTAELASGGAEFAPDPRLVEGMEVERALDLATVRQALARFTRSPVPIAVVLNGADATLRIESDANTKNATHHDGLSPSFSRLRVDLVWRPASWR